MIIYPIQNRVKFIYVVLFRSKQSLSLLLSANQQNLILIKQNVKNRAVRGELQKPVPVLVRYNVRGGGGFTYLYFYSTNFDTRQGFLTHLIPKSSSIFRACSSVASILNNPCPMALSRTLPYTLQNYSKALPFFTACMYFRLSFHPFSSHNKTFSRNSELCHCIWNWTGNTLTK